MVRLCIFDEIQHSTKSKGICLWHMNIKQADDAIAACTVRFLALFWLWFRQIFDGLPVV
jgi:hypothetical protein